MARPLTKQIRTVETVLQRLQAQDSLRPDPLAGLSDRERRIAEQQRKECDDMFAAYLDRKPFAIVSGDDFDPTKFGLTVESTCEDYQNTCCAMLSDISGQNNLRTKLKDVFK